MGSGMMGAGDETGGGAASASRGGPLSPALLSEGEASGLPCRPRSSEDSPGSGFCPATSGLPASLSAAAPGVTESDGMPGRHQAPESDRAS